MFDFVALRDVAENDEILIDYGCEWEQAWNEHVTTWKPPTGSKYYMAAYELNNNLNLTILMIYKKPYPDNLLLYIHDEYRVMSDLNESESELCRCRVLDQYEMEGKMLLHGGTLCC